MSRRYSLLLFGPPIVRRTGADGREEELVWRLRRSVHLVAYLALRPDRRCPRDELVEAIWPDASAGKVQRNFHPTMSDARRTLAAGDAERDAVLLQHDIYILNPKYDWQVDVESFRQLVAAGRASAPDDPEEALEAWAAAWKLHRGTFLAGSEAPWIQAWRDVLRRDYLELLRGLGNAALQLERFRDALDAFRAVLIEEPYEEHVHIRVMELYARQGRRDLVRRQYVRLQEHLKELGVEPLEETQQSYHRLMR